MTKGCWFLLYLLQAGLLARCQPSASSPLELGGEEQPEASDSGEACWAQDYPIVFESTRAPPALELQLFLMKADGNDSMQIGRGGNFHSPVWSPDGRSIAFRRRPPIAGSNARLDVASEVGLMAPDGTEQVVLFADESAPDNVLPFRAVDGPTWSPDGRTLAFASLRDSGAWAVWTVSRSGGQRQLLMPDLSQPHFKPSWARHDASKLAFVADIDGVRDIWLVDVSQPARRDNLTAGLTTERIMNPDSPRWSPDGSRMAFSAEDSRGGGDTEVYVLELSTRALVQVTNDEITNLSPAWSPDGKQLLISSSRAPGSLLTQYLDLWRVPLDGAEAPLQLTAIAGVNAEPDWYGSSSCSDHP